MQFWQALLSNYVLEENVQIVCVGIIYGDHVLNVSIIELDALVFDLGIDLDSLVKLLALNNFQA